MDAAERELLDGLVNRVLRSPDQPRDLDAERALQRLLAARSDAAYLLLQRALVLEAALARVRAGIERQRARGSAAKDGTPDGQESVGTPEDRLHAGGPPSQAAAAASLPARGFLRDAAVISAGVLGGSLLAKGAESLFDGDGAPGMDFDLDDLF